MPAFKVIRKSDQVEVYRYSAEAPVAWNGMEFDTHDHIEVAEPVVVAPEVLVQPVKISRLAFISRFTDSEAIAIDLASQGATVQAAGMRRYMQKVNAAEFIDLMRADTRSGVQALEAVGLIGVGRAAVILDTPPAALERWNG